MTITEAPARLQELSATKTPEESAFIWSRIEAAEFFPAVADCRIPFDELDRPVQQAMRELRHLLDPHADLMCQAIIVVRSHQTRLECETRRRDIAEAQSREPKEWR